MYSSSLIQLRCDLSCPADCKGPCKYHRHPSASSSLNVCPAPCFSASIGHNGRCLRCGTRIHRPVQSLNTSPERVQNDTNIERHPSAPDTGLVKAFERRLLSAVAQHEAHKHNQHDYEARTMAIRVSVWEAALALVHDHIGEPNEMANEKGAAGAETSEATAALGDTSTGNDGARQNSSIDYGGLPSPTPASSDARVDRNYCSNCGWWHPPSECPSAPATDWKCAHGVPHKQCGSCYDQKAPPSIGLMADAPVTQPADIAERVYGDDAFIDAAVKYKYDHGALMCVAQAAVAAAGRDVCSEIPEVDIEIGAKAIFSCHTPSHYWDCCTTLARHERLAEAKACAKAWGLTTQPATSAASKGET